MSKPPKTNSIEEIQQRIVASEMVQHEEHEEEPKKVKKSKKKSKKEKFKDYEKESFLSKITSNTKKIGLEIILVTFLFMILTNKKLYDLTFKLVPNLFVTSDNIHNLSLKGSLLFGVIFGVLLYLLRGMLV